MNIFEIPVHPAADVFPMLDEDELAELANDIAENGLRSPLVVSGLNGDMRLIDGRNRRAACKLVKIEPVFVQLEGDAVSYILSANINRRHLTAGQRTMIVAKIYPEPGKRGRGNKKLDSVKNFDEGALSRARLVLKVLPELADQVIRGEEMLNAAYDKAVMAQKQYNSEPEQMKRLKALAPDLHELAQAGKMPVNEAMGALRTREETKRERSHSYRQTVFQNLYETLHGLRSFRCGGVADIEQHFTKDDIPHFKRVFSGLADYQELKKGIDEGVIELKAMIQLLGEKYGL